MRFRVGKSATTERTDTNGTHGNGQSKQLSVSSVCIRVLRGTAFSRRIASIVLSFVSFVSFVSCSGEARPQQSQGGGGGRGGQQGPVPVTVTGVIRKAVPLEIRVIGTAEAYQTVAIRAQITG